VDLQKVLSRGPNGISQKTVYNYRSLSAQNERPAGVHDTLKKFDMEDVAEMASSVDVYFGLSDFAKGLPKMKSALRATQQQIVDTAKSVNIEL
jgi:hypothetical protein